MNSSKYSWKGFVKKVAQEQSLVTPEKFEEYIIKFFTELKKQLNSTEIDQINDIYIKSLGGFYIRPRLVFQRLKHIEALMENNGLINPEEHLRQVEIIEHIIKTRTNRYDKHAERISRIKEVLARGECGFSGGRNRDDKSDSGLQPS